MCLLCIWCMWCFVSLVLIVSTSAIDFLERLVSKMTYYVSSGTLNHTHSHTHSVFLCVHLGVSMLSTSLCTSYQWYTVTGKSAGHPAYISLLCTSLAIP